MIKSCKKIIGKSMSAIKTPAFRQVMLIVLVMVIAVVPMFAASDGGIDKLDTYGQKLLSLFTSTWVKALLCVALVVEAIAMVMAGQNGGGGSIVKRFAPWILGTIILLSATGICNYFLDGLQFDDLNTSGMIQNETETAKAIV